MFDAAGGVHGEDEAFAGDLPFEGGAGLEAGGRTAEPGDDFLEEMGLLEVAGGFHGGSRHAQARGGGEREFFGGVGAV